MNIFSFLEPLQRVSFALDDSTLSLMALLVGMAGGWRLSVWRDQLKAKRARIRIERKTDVSPRNKAE